MFSPRSPFALWFFFLLFGGGQGWLLVGCGKDSRDTPSCFLPFLPFGVWEVSREKNCQRSDNNTSKPEGAEGRKERKQREKKVCVRFRDRTERERECAFYRIEREIERVCVCGCCECLNKTHHHVSPIIHNPPTIITPLPYKLDP